MRQNTTIGFICCGEVNTPFERIQLKHDGALQALQANYPEIVDGGIVIDDPAYETADAALAKLPSLEVFPDSCTVEEFAQMVSGQHVILAYGNYVEALKDFCKMMDIEVMM